MYTTRPGSRIALVRSPMLQPSLPLDERRSPEFHGEVKAMLPLILGTANVFGRLTRFMGALRNAAANVRDHMAREKARSPQETLFEHFGQQSWWMVGWGHA